MTPSVGGVGLADARTVSVATLASLVVPDHTVLLLGAGASIPSGAPSAAALAKEIARDLAGEVISDDLEETATILEHRYGRAPLVAAVRDRLASLRPSGGLAALPEFPWRRLYTTNFDELVERSYAAARKPLAAIRSNFDYGRGEQLDQTQLLKLHGCVTQDTVDGGRGRIVLTEQDYDEYSAFREVLFSQLETDLQTADVLIIGQSLRDRHLRDLMSHTARLKSRRGAPGRIYALVYEADDDRAALLHRRGLTTAFGGIDEFLHALAVAAPPTESTEADEGDRLLLKPVLRIAAIDVDVAARRRPDAVRLFNGRAATFADINHGLTFRRSAEGSIEAFVNDDAPQFLTVLGVAGVGKTTLARRVAIAAVAAGHYAWEYVRDFAFDHRDWLDVDSQLRQANRRGFVIVDDAPSALRQVNQLADELARRGAGGLKLILTAALPQWKPRLKSPALYANGGQISLSLLESSELEALVRLVDENSDIRALIEAGFAAMSPRERLKQLQERARADMYVCLKNIFANEALDTILLREYAELETGQQDIYRFVAALQASGGRLHRQLVLRVLNVRADEVRVLLEGLEGIVDEQDVAPELGIYAWEARHELIALTIARYKYADEDELYALLGSVIANINPTIHIELRSLREMCTSDMGVQALTDVDRRIELYNAMIEAAPAERIPRHRLIRELLRRDDLDGADQAIRRAESAVGMDRPMHRFKVLVEMRRAEITRGIMDEDRVALLRVAERLAVQGLDRYSDDKYTYATYADVGAAIADRTGDFGPLDDALRQMQRASDVLLDPQLTEDLVRFERRREQLHRALSNRGKREA